MKTSLLPLISVACAAALPASAQGPLRAPVVTELGPDHRVLETDSAPGTPSRRIVLLSNGMNYLSCASDQITRAI